MPVGKGLIKYDITPGGGVYKNVRKGGGSWKSDNTSLAYYSVYKKVEK